jgi:tetratricopeptide (TPR) repeat protein
MIKIKYTPRIILLLILLFTYQVSNAETGNLEKISILIKNTEKLTTEGKYDEALKNAQDALSLRKIEFGPIHHSVAESLGHVACIYYVLGMYEKADSLYKEIIAIYDNELESQTLEVGMALIFLGRLYRGLGNYSKAKQLFNKALLICENIPNPEDLRVLTLNSLGLISLNIGEYIRAEQLLKEALIEKKNKFSLNDPLVGTLISNLGILYYHLGKNTKSELLLKKALKIHENYYGIDHPEISQTLNALGLLYLDLGKYDEAETLFNRALRISEKTLRSEHPTIAFILNNLSTVYLSLQEYNNVEPLLTRALHIFKKVYGLEHYNITLVLHHLALLYLGLGDYNMAEEMYKKILAVNKTLKGSENISTANDLCRLANCYQNIGENEKAEELYKQTIRMYKNGEAPILLIRTQNLLANLYYTIGEYSKGRILHEHILKIRKKKLGLKNIDTATSIHNLGLYYFYIGDYPKAEELYNKALNIIMADIEPHNLLTAWILYNLACIDSLLGKNQEAQEYYEKSLVLFKKKYGPNNYLVADIMMELAIFYAYQGDRKTAHQLMMQSQKINSNLIDHVMEFSSTKRKLNYLTSREKSLHLTLNFIFHPIHVKDIFTTRDILNIWIKRKGLILETQKQYHEALFHSDDKQISQTALKLSEVRNRLSRLIFSNPKGKDTSTYYENKIAKLEKQKEELETILSKFSKAFLTEQKKIDVNYTNLTKAIPSNTVLVEFARIKRYRFDSKNGNQNWLPAHYLAFIIYSDKWNQTTSFDLGLADEIDNEISALRKVFAGVNTDMTKDTISILNKLHSLIFQPLKSKIGDIKKIFISPDGDLSLLPFEILQGKNGKFLIEDYTFNYLSAGRDILGFGETIEENNKSLIIGNPDFNLTDAQKISIIKKLGLKTHNEKRMATRSKDLQSSGSWQSLPGTQDEVQAIHNIIGKNKAELFTGKKAMEETLMYWGGVPKILHLATHGFFLENRPIDFKNNDSINRGFSPQEPIDQIISPSPVYFDTENPLLRSGIVLAGANKIFKTDDDTISDGIVTSEEILGMNLRGTEMVVLSACDTGLGEVKNGEGVFGLRRAFTQAGAKSLVMSMWKVPDKETKELMVKFYSNIYKKGMNRVQALRQATLTQIKTTKQRYGNSNPYYWGAFVFMGEP